ncbi:hexitol phosphatase HxpB [Pseudoalteromonas luteoviolacea]|uniref:Haloacid dehalogenase family hydrolase n=1 Tax=Pseudoalteromonas luteoviolacea (strain 2ta16) TaxID=1353533 RepID=V4JDH7_PSEL2|nr:hexitol phosphatase HxpB [Pseudoalteromonas luteoviolacea]ESP93132.1 haloacid dehalogenase family hydrolase [Pseudoalteromonas luteoviolacea 2ta16]KZN37005.1 hypothetical protein N483_21405 [Pseudoalteromonas luteoviolacea NCIMB 1944]
MIDAVIFDMDGTLIDSEPMWQEAEKQVFGSLGVDVRDELAARTASMTTIQAAEFWYQHAPWEGPSTSQVADQVVLRVAELIVLQGEALAGVHHALSLLQEKQLKIGLATNAPVALIPVVFDKLDIGHYFTTYCSSDNEVAGKPSPDVYLTAAKQMGVLPERCLAVEDSVTGMKAAQAANMRTLVVPQKSQFNNVKFDKADMKLESLLALTESHLALNEYARSANKR